METMTIENMGVILDEAHLNWKVRKEPIQTVSGIEIPEKVAIIREDTNKLLGIHSPNYPVLQNEQLLEILFRISSQTGLVLHSGGCFRGGENVWFQLKSNDLVLPNDRIKGYLSGLNSFDGKHSLALGHSSKTVSCQNTYFAVYRDVETRLRHSLNMFSRIDAILFKVDELLREEQKSFETIKRMTEFQMDAATKTLVTNYLFDIKKEDKIADLSTYKKNRMERFDFDLATEVATKGDTMWALFSGVTRYTTHSMKKGDNSEAKIFGTVGQKEREIWNKITEFVG